MGKVSPPQPVTSAHPLLPYLLQEAEEKIPHGAVGGEEAIDGFVKHVGVESAGGGGQRPQGTQDIARLLPRHGLLQLLHVLFDICGSTRDGPSARVSQRPLLKDAPERSWCRDPARYKVPHPPAVGFLCPLIPLGPQRPA